MKDYLILRNIIKCKSCGSIIESTFRHEFKTCKCGLISVDGGTDYLRRLGDPYDYEDLSEFKEIFEKEEKNESSS